VRCRVPDQLGVNPGLRVVLWEAVGVAVGPDGEGLQDVVGVGVWEMVWETLWEELREPQVTVGVTAGERVVVGVGDGVRDVENESEGVSAEV
jgi:hypothetical protein